MQKIIVILISLFFSNLLFAAPENSKYFVFVGEKISLEPVPPKKGEIPFNLQFLAKYRVLEPYRGSYNGTELEFTVFDHHGNPAFAKYKYVLLYVELHDGKYYHSKYQFSALYKTKSGKWAGVYAIDDYNHLYNKNTTIKPEKMEFTKPVVMDISGYEKENISKWFPNPYFKIKGNKAIAVYGNYINELFLLKQNGVLKARGDFF